MTSFFTTNGWHHQCRYLCVAVSFSSSFASPEVVVSLGPRDVEPKYVRVFVDFSLQNPKLVVVQICASKRIFGIKTWHGDIQLFVPKSRHHIFTHRWVFHFVFFFFFFNWRDGLSASISGPVSPGGHHFEDNSFWLAILFELTPNFFCFQKVSKPE